VPSPAPSPSGPPRSFALTGVSAKIDPQYQAVRPDLADVRLADQVFAPHYAAPMAMRVIADASLHAAPDLDSPMLENLRAGDLFEGLDFAAGWAWGIATASGRVGYVDRTAIDFADRAGNG